MILSTLTLLAVLGIAFANGGNDNFKGVATLFGSRRATYQQALAWATATALAGALAVPVLSGGLVRKFSGKGLVPDEALADPLFRLAVPLAAALTVLAATRLGLPVSTTHGLTGALLGSGLVLSGSEVSLGTLGNGFLLPLLFSPVVAGLLVMGIYPMLRALRLHLEVDHETCVCIGQESFPVVAVGPGDVRLRDATEGAGASLRVGSLPQCVELYRGRVMGVSAQGLLDGALLFSTGLVCFARALNDVPKLLGMAVDVGHPALLGVAAAMCIGGLAHSRYLATVLSDEITRMNPGQAFTATAVTGALVVAASAWALPVSTTHVACGALFGLGAVNGSARWDTIGKIAAAWLVTLPMAAVLGAAAAGVGRALLGA